MTVPEPTRIRVRYSEVDRMGLLYHVNHLEYFEVARSNWIRNFWRSYKEIEDEGYCLIVIEVKLKYIQPAYYDEELIVEVTPISWGRSRVSFTYRIFRKGEDKPVCTGETIHCFSDGKGKILSIPETLRQLLIETYGEPSVS